jgi:hypothetical protein
MDWGNLAQWSSAGATGAGFIATVFTLVVRYRQTRALEFDRNYRLQRPHLSTFWATLRAEWGEFRLVEPNAPASLTAFLRDLTLPPPGRTAPEIADMYQRGSLTPAQRVMWQFAIRIYPVLEEHYPVTAVLSDRAAGASFHDARGALSWFWHTEPRGVPVRHIRHQFLDRWLDLALQLAARSESSGKEYLPEVAKRVWK